MNTERQVNTYCNGLTKMDTRGEEYKNMLTRLLSSCIILFASAPLLWADTDLYVSRHAAKILPVRLVTIPSPEAGELRVHCFGKERVSADTLLAVLNEDTLATEEREAELSLQQQRLDRDKAVLKLRKLKSELEFLKNLPLDRRGFAEQRLQTQVDEQTLASIDEEIELCNERYHLAEIRTRQGIRKKRQACTLTMPFDGRLQYHISLPEKEGECVTVPASTPLVTIIDDSTFYVALPATDPTWSKLDHKRLRLRVDLGSGVKLEAEWHHTKVDKAERGETLFYYFQVPKEEKEKAFSLIGSNLVAELFYKGEDDWLYEKKSDLAMEAGSRFIETWEGLVDTLRPGYTIVFIGETHICLRKKDGCQTLPAPVPAS